MSDKPRNNGLEGNNQKATDAMSDAMNTNGHDTLGENRPDQSGPDHTDNADNADNILEHNVEQLLTRAHEPPTMAPEARARVLGNLRRQVAQRQAPAEKARSDEAADSAANTGWLASWMPGWLGARRLAWAAGGAVAVTAAVVLALNLAGSGESANDLPRVAENDSLAPQRIELPDGSEVILNRDTEIVITGERSLRIERGDILLDVASRKGRFVVEATHGRIEVLGTRFVVNAREAETLASVVRGRVRVENSRGAATLSAGEQGVLRRDMEPIRRRAPRLSHLAGWAQAARRAEEMATPIRSGTLLARNPNWPEQDYPLPMRDLTIDVHVEDQIARVAIDQTFFNAQNWQTEGVYRFPLPPRAAISRLAMYVAGKRMEAAIVEREQGRKIYESIVYRRRDPALLEWMSGNEFKVRIFPLPARQEKRIVLSYTQTLERLYDDVTLTVPIPEVERPVDRVRYRVRLTDCGDCTVRSTSHEIATERESDDTFVTFEREGYVIGDDLLLTIRDGRSSDSIPSDGSTGDADSEAAGAAGAQIRAPQLRSLEQARRAFVMVRANPEIVEPGVAGVDAASKPRRWVILQDTSGSRSPLERKAQSFFIERFVSEIDEYDEINLIAFDATARQWLTEFVPARDIDGEKLAAFLNQQSADGVGYTDLENASRQAVALLDGAPGEFRPHILYVGDGIATGGGRAASDIEPVLAGKATFVAVTLGDTMDAHLMSALTGATGGMWVTANPGDDLSWRAFDLVAALNTPRIVGLKARLIDNTGEPIKNATVYASRTTLADGEDIDVVARVDGLIDVRGVLGKALPGSRGYLPAALELTGMVDGRPWHKRVDLADVEPKYEARYLERLWAQRRIDHLITRGPGDDPDSYYAELSTLGQKNFLMTPVTSLIVLENDAMYKQYRVKRDRKPAWAAYRLPDRIKVVRETAAHSSVAAIDPQAILIRNATRILAPNGDNRWDYHRPRTLRGALGLRGRRGHGSPWGTTGVDTTWSTIGAGGGGATTKSALRGVLGGGGKRDQKLGAGPLGALRDLQPSRSADAPSMDGERAASDPPMAVIGSDKSIQMLEKGTSSASPHTAFVGGLARNKTRRGPPRISGRLFSSSSGWGRSSGELTAEGRFGWMPREYSYNEGLLLPVALHYHSDPNLDDLTEFVPGLLDGVLDAQARNLRKHSATNGSVTDEARALIARARAAQSSVTYRGSGGVMSIDVSGGTSGLTLERTLATGLLERVTYDGNELVHSYPELGLATRRPASDLAAAIYEEFAPFVVPDAESLARWYHVSLDGPRTLVIRAGSPDSADRVEMVLDEQLRLVEIRSIARDQSKDGSPAGDPAQASKPVVMTRFEHRPGGIAIVTPGRDGDKDIRVELTVADGAAYAEPKFDAAGWTVVDMPLRHPDYWANQAAQDDKAEPSSEPGTPAWRHRMIQIMAGQAALRQEQQLWKTLVDFRSAMGGVTLGELVLASRGVRAVARRKDLQATLAGVDHPIADYLAASHDLARRYRANAFDALVREAEKTTEPSLVAMLARYRAALNAISYDGSSKKMTERVKAFIERHPDLPLSYALAHRHGVQLIWLAPTRGVAVWDLLAKGPWGDMAGFEAARILANSGKYDRAVERFEDILERDGDRALDTSIWAAFVRSSRGQTGWRHLWVTHRDRVLAEGKPGRLARLLRTAQETGQQGDIDRITAGATSLELRDMTEALSLARALIYAGRPEAGLTVLEPWLKASGSGRDRQGANLEAEVVLHSLAAELFENTRRYERAAEHLARAIVASGEAGIATDLSVLRSEYQRLIGLHGKIARTSTGSNRDRALQNALAAAADWRSVDPGNAQLDHVVAKLLYSVDRPEQAWRYLSAAIERQPMEGTSYQVVAEVLESEGKMAEAASMWQRFIELEPTDPTGLLRRARVLFTLGKPDEGRALLRIITSKSWHERHDNVVYQARRMAQEQAIEAP